MQSSYRWFAHPLKLRNVDHLDKIYEMIAVKAVKLSETQSRTVSSLFHQDLIGKSILELIDVGDD